MGKPEILYSVRAMGGNNLRCKGWKQETILRMLENNMENAEHPEELVISREEFDNIEAKMSEILSSLEWKVLTYYLEGKSYQEIADKLGRHVKSIDNALQRVKRKLEKFMEESKAHDDD